MKMTLLEMTQDILSSMDSDEVNSIFDTVEATQVATVLKQAYRTVVSRLDAPEHYELFELTPTGSSTPVVMTVADNVDSMEWLKYNMIRSGDTDPTWDYVRFQPLNDFIDTSLSLRPSETYIDSLTLTLSGMTRDFYFHNDRPPTYYTTWDDNTIVFDSYDSAVEAFLQQDKTLAYGRISPAFTLSDSFIVDLDDTNFDLFFNEAKALAFAEKKQTIHATAERNAKRGWTQSQKNKQRVKGVPYRQTLPNYGRK